MLIGKVIVDIASSLVDKIFDYILPSNDIEVGSRVLVPFGKIQKEGYLIGKAETSNIDQDKLKTIISAIDKFPIISSEQLKLADFMKQKFHTGMCDALRLFLPSEMRSGKVKELTQTNCFLINDTLAKEYLSKVRKNATGIIGIIQTLLEKGKASSTELNKQFNPSSLKKLIQDGRIHPVRIEEVYEKYGFLPLDTPIVELSEVLLAKAGGETEKQSQS